LAEDTPRIRLQPKQSEVYYLLKDGFDRVGFGGARGGAKSGGGRRIVLASLLENPGTVGLILRRTYPELYKSHLIKMFMEMPQTRNWWRQQDKEFLLPNGSHLFCGYAQHAADMSDFYSAEFDFILVDEAQEFSQDEMERLSGSNRSTLAGIRPWTLYTFMPGISESGLPPLGLGYLRRVFVDKETREEELRRKWNFVQAFAWDNVEWCRNILTAEGVSDEQFYQMPEDDRRTLFIDRTDFGANLSAITSPGLRDAWLNGLWTKFTGQYFDSWDYDKNTLPVESVEEWLAEMTKLRVKPRWWLSDDWGDHHPNALYLHGMDHKGQIKTVAEDWARGLSEPEIARRAVAMCSMWNAVPEAFIMGWDAFGRLSKHTRQPITQQIAKCLPSNFPPPFPADASPGTRVSGAQFMKQMLVDRWQISRECVKLIECLPNMVRDMERNPEDVLKVDWSETSLGDDPYDSARMGLQYVSSFTPQIPKPPAPVESGQYEAFRLKERIEGMDKRNDPEVVTHISNLPKRRRHFH
jgi:hypothetical protein